MVASARKDRQVNIAIDKQHIPHCFLNKSLHIVPFTFLLGLASLPFSFLHFVPQILPTKRVERIGSAVQDWTTPGSASATAADYGNSLRNANILRLLAATRNDRFDQIFHLVRSK